jgi:outer membrane protein assembly factor BamD (BamD/ComL family)
MKPIAIVLLSFLMMACKTPSTDSQKQTSTSTQLDTAPRLIKNYFGDCKKLRQAAKSMDSTLLNELDLDKTLATKAIKAFTDYAYYCQGDSLSPIFLIKTAQVAKAINNIPQAKIVLDRCIENYPQFYDRAAAIFLLAQLYDENTYMNNEMEAKRLYQQIIDEYPKSDWAVSAKGAIHFIGKSDEQIAREFLKKKK